MKIEVKDGNLLLDPGPLNKAQFEQYCSDVKASGGSYERAYRRTIIGEDQLIRFGYAMAVRGWQPQLTYSAIDMLRHRADMLREAQRYAEEIGKEKGLFPYQVEGVAFLRGRTHALLADDMGLGKTVQALCALPERQPVLVVCPVSVRAVWHAAFKRWRPDLEDLAEIYGPNEVKELNTRGYEIRQNTTMIVDEAHYFKNPKAFRTRMLRTWAKECARVWMLTGTPLITQPQDLWGILQATKLGERAFGSWTNFVRVFDGFAGEWGGYEWGPNPDPEAAEMMSTVMLRRTKAEVMEELPPKTYSSIEVSLQKGHWKAIQSALTAEDMEYLQDKLAQDSAKDIQLMSKVRRILSLAKKTAIFDYIKAHKIRDENGDDPLVVFSDHVETLVAIGDQDGWDVITGQTPPAKRAEIVDAFQRGELVGLACSIGAAGTGITLTRSSHTLFIDRSWSPSNNDQAEDRTCRIGQTRGCRYVDFVSNHPLDKLSYNVNVRKRKLINATVERVYAKDKLLTQLEQLLENYR